MYVVLFVVGQQLSRANMVDIIDFCHNHKLLLLADEVSVDVC